MKKDKNIKDRILPFLLRKENKKSETKKEQVISSQSNEVKIEETIETTQTEEEPIIHRVEEVLNNSTLTQVTEQEQKKDTSNKIITIKKVEASNKAIEHKKIKEQDKTIESVIGTIISTPLKQTPILEDKEKKIIPKDEIKPIITPLSQNEKMHLAIIEEIKEYIDDDLKEIDEITYKIKELKEQEKEEVLLEKAEKTKKELEELIKRIEELRIKYEKIYGKIKIQDISVIDNDILEMSIKDYIEATKDGKDTSDFFNKIEEVVVYLDVLNKIIDVDKEKDELEVKVDEKIDLFEERDQDFEEAMDSKVNIEKINFDIEKYNEIVKSALSDLETKMSKSTEINTRIETTQRRAINFGRIIAASIMLAQTPHIPPTPRGMLLRTGLVAAAIHLLLNATYTETTTRKINTVTYIDFKNEILTNKELITDSLKMIGPSFDELQQVKKMFEDEFEEYARDIPEYQELIKNIIDLEKELQRQEEKANEYSNELDEKLKINNEKIKTIESIPYEEII